MYSRTIYILLALLLVTAGCGPPATQAATPTAEPVTTQPPVVVPTDTPIPPTSIPEPPTLTPTPELVTGWASHASTGSELSFENPGNWFGPAVLPNKDGVYVKDPDKDLGVFMRFWTSGDPATRLATWGTEGIDLPFVLKVTFDSVTDGSLVTISRLEGNTKIAQGGGITAQVTFVRRPQGTMEVVWFAPANLWDAYQQIFTRFLASLEAWQSHTSHGLLTMYLHDWSAPANAPEGQGTWYHSTDEKTGLVFWIQPPEDPKKLLEAWTPDRLAAPGFSDCGATQAGERYWALQANWDTKTGTCKDASGAEVTYVIGMIANRDRILEVVTYAPPDQWEYLGTNRIFSTMLSLLTDIR